MEILQSESIFKFHGNPPKRVHISCLNQNIREPSFTIRAQNPSEWLLKPELPVSFLSWSPSKARLHFLCSSQNIGGLSFTTDAQNPSERLLKPELPVSFLGAQNPSERLLNLELPVSFLSWSPSKARLHFLSSSQNIGGLSFTTDARNPSERLLKPKLPVFFLGAQNPSKRLLDPELLVFHTFPNLEPLQGEACIPVNLSGHLLDQVTSLQVIRRVMTNHLS